MGEVKDTVKGAGPKKKTDEEMAASIESLEAVSKRAKKNGKKGGKKIKKLMKLLKGEQPEGNLIVQLTMMGEEVSRCVEIKDTDSMTEGNAAKPENERKAATLRAVHSLLTTAQTLLEDY